MTCHTGENEPQHNPIGIPNVNHWARHIRPGGAFPLGLVRRVVLRGIGLYADVEGHASLSQGTIAERLECSKGTVNRAIKALEALGLLTIEKAAGENDEPCHLYRLAGADSDWQPTDYRGTEHKGGQQA